MLFALVLTLATGAAPAGWTCDASAYADGICDCGCNAADSDCDSANFKACARTHCAEGQVPWEHQSSSCMESTCGDGWKAEDEVCDDANALASGGCSADCSSVNDGFVCGEGASGCTKETSLPPNPPDASDAGHLPVGPQTDEVASGYKSDGAPKEALAEDLRSGGCSSAPSALLLGALLVAAWVPSVRRRRRACVATAHLRT